MICKVLNYKSHWIERDLAAIFQRHIFQINTTWVLSDTCLTGLVPNTLRCIHDQNPGIVNFSEKDVHMSADDQILPNKQLNLACKWEAFASVSCYFRS